MSDAKILVFSDNADTRQAIIDGVGIRASKDTPLIQWFEAATAFGAIEVFKDNNLDLMIFDAEVQKHGGMGVAHEIIDTFDNVPPVIILTARQQDNWLATWAGATEVISAPYSPIQLQESVARLLGGK